MSLGTVKLSAKIAVPKEARYYSVVVMRWC